MKLLSFKDLIAYGIPNDEAYMLSDQINQWISKLRQDDVWKKISTEFLTPTHSFDLHLFLYQFVYYDRKINNPGAAFFPDEKTISESNIHIFMQKKRFKNYQEFHQWSYESFTEFWDEIIHHLSISFQSPYHTICDLEEGYSKPHWLPGAKFNIAAACLDRNDNDIAIIYKKQNEKIKTIDIKTLKKLSYQVANSLNEYGLEKNDIVALAMTMTVESIAIYLGTILAGCTIVSIAESYSVNEIKTRLEITKPKLIFTQDVIQRKNKLLPLYEKVKEAYSANVIVLPSNINYSINLKDNDKKWEDFLNEKDTFTPISCLPHDYINILFSSGTTGTPKAIPWTHTTPIKCASDAFFHHNIKPNDRLCWPTSLGWMMGPWLVFASLLNKATIALYYDAPIERSFGEFIQDAHITMLGLVPSIVKQWRTTQCMYGLDWSNLKIFSSTGESSNPEDMLYLMSLAAYKPIIEYCGGTEIGGAYISSTVIEPNIPSTFTTPTLGLDFKLLDEQNHFVDNGEIAILSPSIGLSTELLNKGHEAEYFEGMPILENSRPLRRHGDHFEKLDNGYFRSLGRIDDTMNLGGIKVSSAEIERSLLTIPAINECAAIAVSPSTGGPSELIIHVVPIEKNINITDLKKLIQKILRDNLNPLFKVKDVMLIDALPRTASNKVMRRLLRDQYINRYR